MLEATDRLTSLGLQIGGIAFALVSVYLLYGIIAGSLSKAGFFTGKELERVLQNVQVSCKILTVSGVMVIVSGCIRFYLDESTGYFLLLAGAALRWGMPVLVGSSLRDVAVAAATLPAYVAAQYSFVGTVSLIVAVPFLLADVVRKLLAAKHRATRQAITLKRDEMPMEEEEMPKRAICVFCWQMPYCRNYLRAFCQAYERRRPCWRIKSGCYCDEEMIMRMMKRSPTSKMSGNDQAYAWVAGGHKQKDLTPAQKRQRCRECQIYIDHQKEKYRIMGPLSFPTTAALMYMFVGPVKQLLHRALDLTDQFAARLSYGPMSQASHQLSSSWADTPAASNTVEWLFLACICLLLLTYILRTLEFFIFNLQL